MGCEELMEESKTDIQETPKLVATLTGMDTKPAESLALILRSIGFEVFMLTDDALARYRTKGYTGGVDQALLRSMGYADAKITPTDKVEGVFFDLKLKDLESMMKIHPEVKGVLAPINGGYDDYEHYGDHYPTVTNNFWIRNAFHFYSPMVGEIKPKEKAGDGPPVDLLHNAYNWGMRSYIDEIISKTGLQIYGSYGSPAGLIHNDKVPELMKNARAFVHIKASDCPGWALWEAFASATPVVVMSLFTRRMKFEDLYIDGETCLTWGDNIFEQDKEDPRIIREFVDREMPKALEELYAKVDKLKSDPEYAHELGMRGHLAWKKKVEWTPEKAEALKKYLISRNVI